MKIKQTTGTWDDYRNHLKIEIDGKTVFQASDGEPEDATLGRDFNDCYSVVDLMERAYEAGKNGESFEIECVEENE